MTDQKQIVEAIAEDLALPAADIDMEASLQSDLGLNPVEVADLFESLSVRFNVIFEQSDTHQVQTVGDLVEMVEDKLLE